LHGGGQGFESPRLHSQQNTCARLRGDDIVDIRGAANGRCPTLGPSNSRRHRSSARWSRQPHSSSWRLPVAVVARRMSGLFCAREGPRSTQREGRSWRLDPEVGVEAPRLAPSSAAEQTARASAGRQEKHLKNRRVVEQTDTRSGPAVRWVLGGLVAADA
jgi:hypothetical protein